MATRTRGFDANDSDDEDYSHLSALSHEQFHTNQQALNQAGHNRHKRARFNDHQQQQNQDQPQDQKASHDKYTTSYSDVANHYNLVTMNAGGLEDRKKSVILRLRNMNNWIKSISINMFIFQAQEHISALAREIGIDPTMICQENRDMRHPRMPYCMFNMTQRADGIWDLTINNDYPLPLNTVLRIQGIREIDEKDDDIILPAPLTNRTFAHHRVENDRAQAYRYHDVPLHGQRQNIYLLDLCGGKGGDLYKYMENDLGGYVLADIADESVRAAIDRYTEAVQAAKGKYASKRLFPAKFMAGNLCVHRLHEFLHPSITFDVVSTQFAFHYSFQTEATLRGMLENISDRLRPGGFFTCTVPDARVLTAKLRETNSLTFGNNIYQVEFKPTPQLLSWLAQHDETHHIAKSYTDNIDNSTFALDAKNADEKDITYHHPQPAQNPFHSISPFGIQYTFSLEEAVHGVPEYLIIFPVLCQIAAEYGLKPVLYENMSTFFHNQYHKGFLDNKQNPYDLLSRVSVFEDKSHGNSREHPDPKFPRDQWEGVSVYCVMGFQKVGEIQYEGRTIYYDDLTTTVSHLDHINNPQTIDTIFSHIKPPLPPDLPFANDDPTFIDYVDEEFHPPNHPLSATFPTPRFNQPDIRTAGSRIQTDVWGEIRPMNREELINCFEHQPL